MSYYQKYRNYKYRYTMIKGGSSVNSNLTNELISNRNIIIQVANGDSFEINIQGKPTVLEVKQNIEKAKGYMASRQQLFKEDSDEPLDNQNHIEQEQHTLILLIINIPIPDNMIHNYVKCWKFRLIHPERYHKLVNIYGEIEQLNTSQVLNMSGLFENIKDFNLDISNWDTSRVTDMSNMFNNAYAFDQPIGKWDTSQVKSMMAMFQSAKSFNKPINRNGKYWNTSRVTNMTSMFFDAQSFNQPIGNWDTSRVKTMNFMFCDAKAFDKPIGNWDTSNVRNMSYMFSNASSFNQPINNWKTYKVIDMSYMFSNASSFNQDISNWDTSELEDYTNMFDS